MRDRGKVAVAEKPLLSEAEAFEAAVPELARLCDRAERDAETKRQTLSREKMKRLRFILFGKLPEESGQSSGNESRHP